jgi:hypothetical protein
LGDARLRYVEHNRDAATGGRHNTEAELRTVPGKRDLISCIIPLRGQSYNDWHAITNQWACTAEKLAGAVTKDEPERAEIPADGSFAQSYCRQLINA